MRPTLQAAAVARDQVLPFHVSPETTIAGSNGGQPPSQDGGRERTRAWFDGARPCQPVEERAP